jgi:hypothetical protein
MVILLALLFWQSPPAPKPGPFGSDPRYVNRYFQPSYPEGDVEIPKSGTVKITFSDGFVSPPTCIFTGQQRIDTLDAGHTDYQIIKAQPGTIHYKCTGQVRRKLKAVWDREQKRWACEPGWRPFDAMADETKPQPCLEAWDGQEVPKETRPPANGKPIPGTEVITGKP